MEQKEKDVLQKQFSDSRYAKNPPKIPPKRMAIIHFDNALFLSPQPCPTLWTPQTISKLKAVNTYGPGWLNDIRSLDVGPLEEMKKTAWEGFWNEKVLKESRDCIADPDTMTVLSVDRPQFIFHDLIHTMLESKGLEFDLVAMFPEPAEAPAYRWTVESRKDFKLTYLQRNTVFPSFSAFRNRLLINILSNIPTIKDIYLIDKGNSSVKKVRQFLRTLNDMGGVENPTTKHVSKQHPPYNPTWEKATVAKMIDSHELALEAMYHGATSQGWEPVEPKLKEPCDRFLSLTTESIGTCIEILPSHLERLKQAFEPLFVSKIEACQDKKYTKEDSVFFGDTIRLSRKSLERPCCGVLGHESTVQIMGVAVNEKNGWLSLKVCADNRGTDKHFHVLPLWYRPFQEDMAHRRKQDWEPCEALQGLTGLIVYDKRISVSKPAVPKSLLPEPVKKVKKTPKRRILPLDVEIDNIITRTQAADREKRVNVKEDLPKPTDPKEKPTKRFKLKKAELPYKRNLLVRKSNQPTKKPKAK